MGDILKFILQGRMLDVRHPFAIALLFILPLISITFTVNAILIQNGIVPEKASRDEVVRKAEDFIKTKVRDERDRYIFGYSDYVDGVSEARMTVRVAQDTRRFSSPADSVMSILVLVCSALVGACLATTRVIISLLPIDHVLYGHRERIVIFANTVGITIILFMLGSTIYALRSSGLIYEIVKTF